jgi:acetate---CoA ligase (ADP-forming)
VTSERESAVSRLLKPRSIAVVGAQAEPASLGGAVLANLQRFGFAGDLHLVSRTKTEINGLACVPTIDALPEGLDVVVLVVPAAAIVEAVSACVRRKAGAAVIFASGFGEAGDEGKAAQAQLAAIARDGNLALLGPNCLGAVNYAAGIPLTFEALGDRPALSGPGIGVIAQSGAMAGTIRYALTGKGLPVSHVISTGNEADLGAEDFLGHLVDDDATRVITLFVEQIRRPRHFCALAARARAKAKPIVLLHPGRSAKARAAAQSHTGALAGDHAVMRTLLGREAVVLVDTLDELFDVSALLHRYPRPPAAGAAVLTNSGAFRGLTLDFAEEFGLPLPDIADATKTALAAVLPPLAVPDNPLDVTTGGMTNPDLFGGAARALLDDPAIGSLIVSVIGGAPRQQMDKARSLIPVLKDSTKPASLVYMGDESPLDPECAAFIRQSGVPFLRSPDRALRAMARVAAFGRALAAPRKTPASMDTPPLPSPGIVPEYRSKELLSALGIATPLAILARSEAEARTAAARIGYPVVLKAQAAALPHKSDAGGVIAGIADEAALAAAWQKLQADVRSARPDLTLDGVLVEAMAARGVELLLGARRDADWEPVLVVGLGGVWAEALSDVQLLPADAGEGEIVEALRALKGSRLLMGFRGMPPVDLFAVARAAMVLGNLIRSAPAIGEIEINPLMTYENGAVALDALMVVTPTP